MSFWDERYRGDTYAYGTEPNDFLRASVGRIPRGRVLCLAEGEGRNAVYLASLGYAVTAVDLSAEGLRKAARLARERGVVIELVQADLSSYELPGDLAGIVSIFAHIAAAARQRLHAQVSAALRVGGALVLEAYRPEQLAFGTGGPRDVALLPTLVDLKHELASLELVLAQEVEREVHEGAYHNGPSATVQLVGLKPD